MLLRADSQQSSVPAPEAMKAALYLNTGGSGPCKLIQIMPIRQNPSAQPEIFFFQRGKNTAHE